MTVTDDFINALPKVELHVHLVGSASVPTVLELARRHTGHDVPTNEAALREFFEFRDFPHFAEVYFAVNGLIREPEDVATLKVCPTSNVCTKQVPDIAAHPLPRMLAEGLYVTLNSDDPPMFGTTLTNEYRVAARDLGLDREGLADLARNGVRASFLPEDRKRAILAEIDAVRLA